MMTTVAPILEHSIAVARPMPDDAPVTRIILPSSENGLYIGARLYDVIQILDGLGLAHIVASELYFILLINHCNN